MKTLESSSQNRMHIKLISKSWNKVCCRKGRTFSKCKIKTNLIKDIGAWLNNFAKKTRSSCLWINHLNGVFWKNWTKSTSFKMYGWPILLHCSMCRFIVSICGFFSYFSPTITIILICLIFSKITNKCSVWLCSSCVPSLAINSTLPKFILMKILKLAILKLFSMTPTLLEGILMTTFLHYLKTILSMWLATKIN